MKTAAGILVFNGPRVLAFRRYDAEGLALPCGLVEKDESEAQAAIREAKEETGFDVEIVDKPPYVGFEMRDNSLVTTFLATIRGGDLVKEAPTEGTPIWASVREIVQGPYWHYNQRALRHFGIRPPLTGKFHSHLTFHAPSLQEAERAAKLTGGKLTIIDLSREGRQQTDWMITHHYVTGARGLEDQFDIEALLQTRALQLEGLGFQVLRQKLEYDLLHERSDRNQAAASLDSIYTEIHVKCLLPPNRREELIRLASAYRWHPSRNPFATRIDGLLVQFVNRRFYAGHHAGHGSLPVLPVVDFEVDTLCREIIHMCEILEIKYESAVYDTNEAHDRWWMSL